MLEGVAMSFKHQCIKDLESQSLFQNSLHLTRMKELLDCFSDKPFFNKGICKCMYLSAWDDEHFAIILEMLNVIALGKHQDTVDMEAQGDAYIEESDELQSPLYQLSQSFLTGLPYEGAPLDKLPEGTRYIMECALKAADVIDRISL